MKEMIVNRNYWFASYFPEQRAAPKIRVGDWEPTGM
jgi:hypothetical protein